MPRTVAGNILHNQFPLKTEGSLCAMPEHHSAKTSPGKWKDLAPYASSTLFASSASLILLGKKHYIKCCRPCHPTEEVYVWHCPVWKEESMALDLLQGCSSSTWHIGKCAFRLSKMGALPRKHRPCFSLRWGNIEVFFKDQKPIIFESLVDGGHFGAEGKQWQQFIIVLKH